MLTKEVWLIKKKWKVALACLLFVADVLIWCLSQQISVKKHFYQELRDLGAFYSVSSTFYSNLQSWPLKLGHLTLPTPLNQCCNQTWYAMQFARRVHSNTTLKGGGGEDENWISKKTKQNKTKNKNIKTKQNKKT